MHLQFLDQVPCIRTPATSNPVIIHALSGAAAAQWRSIRWAVVALLQDMVGCSPATRAKLWASNGLDLFLALLAEEVCINQHMAWPGTFLLICVATYHRL